MCGNADWKKQFPSAGTRFLTNPFMKRRSLQELSESFEEDITWIDFRQEIEALSVDGSWTSRAADLLPLALANWSGRLVKIFSSLANQPIIDVHPTLK
jgi:hypothetical protein